MPDPSSIPIAFISHAKTDAKQAADIAAALERNGVKCWIAPRDVEPGRNFGDEIIRGIEASRAFILVLSNASNGSDFVAKELATAVGKKKTVFPIRIEEVEPSPSLALFIAGTHWIDAFGGRLGAEADRLASLLSGQPKPAPAPLAIRQSARSRWVRRAAVAMAAAAALTALIFSWPFGGQTPVSNTPTVDPVVIDPSTVPEDVPQIADTGQDTDVLVGQMPAGS
ncbi:MAG: toll/interleukin-1 receptor domain-containing protein, partial [Methyloceanibacter sp.]